MIPVLWQQGEISFHNLFWSARWDGIRDFHLASGFHPMEVLKLFSSHHLEGVFRTRHFSYLVEMLSFKLWQALGIVSFRDFSLIFLHLVNTALVFWIVRQITQNNRPAILAAALSLNSGIALGTLLFPFRHSKPLIVLLFLLGWAVVIAARGDFLNPAKRAGKFFFLIFLLALFTDEIAVFLFPVVVAYIFFTEKIPREKMFYLLKCFVLTVGVYWLLKTAFFIVDANLSPIVTASMPLFYLKKVLPYYENGRYLYDSARALGAYFLRRNFGFWEWSGWGIVSFAAFGCLVWLASRRKPRPLARWCALMVLLAFVVKSLCFPLLWIDPVIMPRDTVFPSTLYFGYYYTYGEAIFWALAMGFLLSESVAGNKKFFLAGLTAVSLISASNVIHAREAVEPTLETHGFYKTHRHAIPKILAIQEKLRSGQGPVYLAFPAGSQPYFSRANTGDDLWESDPVGYRQELSPYFMNYATIIPVQYLRRLEKGELMMSLKNVRSPQPFPEGEELKHARIFYDVPRQESLDLAHLKNIYGTESFVPAVSAAIPIVKGFVSAPGDGDVIVFVKGAARVVLRSSESQQTARQRYGYSYEMFRFPARDFLKGAASSPFELIVSPVPAGGEFAVVGPFWVAAK